MPLLFLTLAAVIVVPLDVAQYVAAPGAFLGADTDLTWLAIMAFAAILIAQPLVSAMHANAVFDLGEGRRPAISSTLRRSLGVLPTLAATTVLGLLPMVVVGAMFAVTGSALTVLLLFPAIYFSVVWCTADCAVAVERKGPFAALRRSYALMEDSWWRAFGLLILTGIIATIATDVPVAVIEARVDQEAMLVALYIASDIVTMSVVALVTTLLFFDLRARTDLPS